MSILSYKNCLPPPGSNDRSHVLLIRINQTNRQAIAELRLDTGEYIVDDRVYSYKEAYERGYRVY